MESTVSPEHVPLHGHAYPRMRPDLEVSVRWHASRRHWAIKNPVAGRYFLLREEEFAILQMLDGQTKVRDVVRRFAEQFSPRRLSHERCLSFLNQLHRDGLTIADAEGQSQQLYERGDSQRRQQLAAAAGNLFAIRVPGINPERLLCWLYPKCRWMFSGACIAVCVLIMITALVLVAVRFSVVQDNWPSFRSLLAGENALWLVTALVVVKVLHELAHGLTCRHLGVNSHEMGILFLAFVPCLYCDVSDSWMLPNKWQRIAVAAAGIYLELVVAAVATLIWWFTEPGLLHTICRNTMLVCSAGTVLLNGNPLLRFDGYFILSDVMDVPNLWSRSRGIVSRTCLRWGLGLELGDERALPETHVKLLAVYAIASIIYQWTVVLALLWLMKEVLTMYHLSVFVPILAATVVAGLVAPSVAGGWRLVTLPDIRQRVLPPRVVCSGVLALGALLGIWLMPLPLRVKAPAVVRPYCPRTVYVTAAGRLKWSAQAGDRVSKGQPLAELENLQVRLLATQARADYEQQQLHVDNLVSRRNYDLAAKRQIPVAKDALRDLTRRLQEMQRQEARLTLRAPADGYVLPPPKISQRRETPGRLPTWSGSPLDERNLLSYLADRTAFCQVGDPKNLEAVLVIDQRDIDFVRAGQRVRVALAGTGGNVLRGEIKEIARYGAKISPRDASSSVSPLVPKQSQRPIQTLYEARVLLDEHDSPLLIGMRGRAKIAVEPQPLGQRLFRYLRNTFST